jgi:caffeoyl-CoA O-methyltransferase
MKRAADAILRTEQASYLDALHGKGQRALAALAGTLPALAAQAAALERDPLLARMEARAAERRYPISDPEVACFLSIVARMAAPKVVFELGTNIGYGAIVLARAAGEGARVVTVEYSPELVVEARGFIREAGLAGRIEVRQGTAIEELQRFSDPIDLLYVDCVKEEYPRYLEIAVPKLSARGVIVADNTLWMGEVAQTRNEKERVRAEALGAFNTALVTRPELCGVVLPLGDGVGFAVRI